MYGQIVSSEDADFNANLIRELTKPRAVKEVAYQVPVETPDQDATLEVPETTSAVQAVELEAPLVAEAEAAPTAPAVIDESKSAEVAQPEASFANFEAAAVEPVVPAALVEASRSEAVRPVESLTNSDVEALEVNILNVERRSEVAGPEERVEPEESTIGFEVEAVEAEPGHIEQTVEASDDGESGAELGFGAEVVEVEPEPQAVEADGAHLALAIEDGEPAVGDVSALVLEVVEPEETQPAPEETVQEREWVEGEFLLEETAPEDHVVPNPLVEAAAAEALPASMLDEFVVAAEAAELDDSAAGDGQAMKVTEAEVLEQLEDNPTGEIIEVMKLDESTD